MKRDKPDAELAGVNQGGTAEAEWTYHYRHDPENPLKEKPKYFFIATTPRAKEVKSGNVEIGMHIDIPICYDNGEQIADLDYTLIGVDGAEEQGRTAGDGKIQSDTLLPGNYTVSIAWQDYTPPDAEGEYTDLAAVGEECKIITTDYGVENYRVELVPGQSYLLCVNRSGGKTSR